MLQDTHSHTATDAMSGTPIFLVFGQSNAGLLSHTGAMQAALDAVSSDAVLLTVAQGGTSVGKPDGDWNIVTGDGADAPGYLYADVLEAVAAAKREDPTAYLAGAVWVQGESDRSVNNDYYTAAKTLFDAIRADLDVDFPITIVGLSELQQGSDGAGHAHVVDAQMQLASDLPQVQFLDTNDLIATSGMTPAEIMRDTLHYNPAFYDVVAMAVLDQPVMQDALGLAHHGPAGHMAGLVAPGIGASDTEIQIYLDALSDLDETHMHDAGSPLAAEHMAAIDLVPRDAATHVAIADGDWDDPKIWSNGQVPGDDARVLIPQGVTVIYDTVRSAEIFTLRIDGKLSFATDVDSKIIFDTMVVAPDGHLEIGTVDNPVDPDVTIDLIIADNGAIDTAWDPMLLSRGIISHGQADIHGAQKDSHEKVLTDPMTGDVSLSFAELPEGWEVGDTIVIAGTRFDGHKWNNDVRAVTFHEPEDEVRVISRIEGSTVFFDDPLDHDHDTPRADLKTSVANYTRNITVASESGDATDVFARGHVMFMHSDEVDVRYAAFHELGRTDKSEPSFHVSTLDDVSFDSNIQGRYALHLHRTGVEDLDNPTLLQGNAVFGSPGWGIVHHDSNAQIDNNATYNTFGAGFVAETGNETGAWTDNIAIFAEGVGWGKPKNLVELSTFDIANGGDGFWFQGRLVDAKDNVAASVDHGYVYFHRDRADRMIDVISDNFAFAGALDGAISDVDDVPIRVFSGNETFAANEGIHVVKANVNQGHDVWTTLEDLTAWEVRTGAHLEYTSHYNLTGFDVIGKEATPFSQPLTGIEFGPNITEMVVVDASIEGFPVGVKLAKKLIGNPQDPGAHAYFIVNPTFTDVAQQLDNFDPVHDTLINDLDIDAVTPSLALDGPLTYSDDHTDAAGRRVVLTGTKTDTLGETDFPGGVDTFDISYNAVRETLDAEGYWTTSDGQNYFIIEVYLSDRLTGEVYVENHPVFIDDNVSLGNQFSRYADAKNNGIQDLVEMPNGMLMAGDVPLGVAARAVPFAHVTTEMSDHGHDDGNADEGHSDQDVGVVEEDVRDVEQDTGDSEQDAGDAGQDAGEVEQDAGDVEQDAGEVEQDAGDAGQGAGEVEQDANDVEQDANDGGQDAGDIEQDANDGEQDAGEVEQDASDVEQDTNEVVQDADEVEQVADDVAQDADDEMPPATGDTHNHMTGGFGNDVHRGGSNTDIIMDAGGDDTVFAGGGDDLILMLSGQNTANGGAGDDLIVGGYGNDDLQGDAGNDILIGDSGFGHGSTDRLVGGMGDDLMDGGMGADTFGFVINSGSNTIAALDVAVTDGVVSATIVGADFVSGVDVIALTGFGYADRAEAFSHVADINGTAVFSDQGTTITFADLSAADLSANDFNLF